MPARCRDVRIWISLGVGGAVGGEIGGVGGEIGGEIGVVGGEIGGLVGEVGGVVGVVGGEVGGVVGAVGGVVGGVGGAIGEGEVGGAVGGVGGGVGGEIGGLVGAVGGVVGVVGGVGGAIGGEIGGVSHISDSEVAMLMTSDADALLAAIRHAPDDDAPRLIFADWLDERGDPEAAKWRLAVLLRAICNEPERDDKRLEYAAVCEQYAGTVECGKCSNGAVTYYKGPGATNLAFRDCPTCHGHGTVSNGLAERGELIRVQVELARLPDCLHPFSRYGECRYCDLSQRSRDLLAAHGERWADDELLLPLNVPSYWVRGHQGTPERPGLIEGGIRWYWSRGFIHRIECTTETFLGSQCHGCSGGVAGFYGEYPCEDCHGSGRVGGIAGKLATCVPIEEVWLTDISVIQMAEYWTITPPQSGWSWSEPIINLKSEQDARTALARAAAAYCRERAGLEIRTPHLDHDDKRQ